MWVEIKKTENLTSARQWKELIESDGIPTRILPASGEPMGKESAAYRVLVPEDKKHLLEEILRKA